MLWVTNLNHSGSPPGTPVGGVGKGQQLLLLRVGRCWWAAILLAELIGMVG